MGVKPKEELNMGRGANWTLACCFSPSGRLVAAGGLNQKIRWVGINLLQVCCLKNLPAPDLNSSVGDWRYQLGRSYALHQVYFHSLVS